MKWNKTGLTILGNGSGSEPQQLAFPDGWFLEPQTQILYIADLSNNQVQKRYPNGEVVTAAGQADGTSGTTADKLATPVDAFADGNENVLVAG